MINPSKVTDFNRTSAELEEFLLFAIVVAGKSAFQQAAKLEAFLALEPAPVSPFTKIFLMDKDGKLEENLRSVKMGQYNRVTTAFRAVANFFACDSRVIMSIRLLEAVKGIGMKTARFWFMHTMPNQQLACLDTHILRWLGEKGHEVPKTTPNGQKYLELEKIFLAYAKDMNILPADLDLQIWNAAQEKK